MLQRLSDWEYRTSKSHPVLWSFVEGAVFTAATIIMAITVYVFGGAS